MQQLFKYLEDHIYVYKFRTIRESITVRNIFQLIMNLSNCLIFFLLFLVMDSTYKINKYKIPLFEIVRVTSTELTYSILL